jgi:hypothetical protein
MTQQRRILSFTFSAAALLLLPSSEPVWLLFPNYRVRNVFRSHSMTQSSKILWFTFCVAALLLLPSRAAAQSGTVTDDAFLSTNSTIPATQSERSGNCLDRGGFERHRRQFQFRSH